MASELHGIAMACYDFGMQITQDVSRYSETDEPSHHWSMIVDGEIVSELWVSTDVHEIVQVETSARHQGNGYASALYRAAAAVMPIFHAPASHRTPDGDRFARSVGGDALACRYGCC